MINNGIVKLPHKVADNDDEYDSAYDYNYYITEDYVANLDN